MSVVVYAVSFLLTRALSRYRELAADRAGAMLTGRPSALASALTKVSGDIARIPTRDLRAGRGVQRVLLRPGARARPSLSRCSPPTRRCSSGWTSSAAISAELGQAGC